MAKISTNISIDSNLKANAVEFFSKLGLDLSTAITLFLAQAIREQRIPFEIGMNPSSERATTFEPFGNTPSNQNK